VLKQLPTLFGFSLELPCAFLVAAIGFRTFNIFADIYGLYFGLHIFSLEHFGPVCLTSGLAMFRALKLILFLFCRSDNLRYDTGSAISNTWRVQRDAGLLFFNFLRFSGLCLEVPLIFFGSFLFECRIFLINILEDDIRRYFTNLTRY
jgi:hypothetical protein